MAAPTTMAVPCWSSWKTGIFIRSRSFFDVETFRRLDVLEVDAAEGRFQRGDGVDQLVGSRSSISRSKTSMLANFLNSTRLASITGLAASGPIGPGRAPAVPLVITPTRLLREGQVLLAGIFDDLARRPATPGE